MFIDLLIFIAVVGLVVWLLCLLPLDAPFKQIIKVVGIIAVVLKLLAVFVGVHVLGL